MKNSKQLTKKFNKYYPGGHSNLRVPRDITKHRLFIKRSQGAHLVDVDDNEYIEFNGAMGPNILGHTHPEFIKRFKEYITYNGTAIGSNLLFSQLDIDVAEKLCKYVPCVEEVKFINSGSEAVQMAFRIMRAYTQKNIILRIEGHYAGWFDNVIGGKRGKNNFEDSEPYAYFPKNDFKSPFYTEGKFPGASKETFIIKWNDFSQLETVFDKYHKDIAGIHLEGIVWNNYGLYPKPGYLEKVRELCDKYNVIFCMDEILTGFRVNIGGAQKLLGVTPDICTMGKAISNGLPVSCVGGKKEIMGVIRDKKVLVPGTFSGFGLGQWAVNATIDILSKDNFSIYKKVFSVQQQIMDGLVEISQLYNIPLTITESNGIFATLFGIEGGRKRLFNEFDLININTEMTNLFRRHMQEQGILLMSGGRWYISAAHTVNDVDKVLNAANISMKKISNKISH